MSRSKKDGKHGGGHKIKYVPDACWEKLTGGDILQNVTSTISTCVRNVTIGESANTTEVRK